MIRTILVAVSCVVTCLVIYQINVTSSFGAALRAEYLYGLMALVCAVFVAAWWVTRPG